LHGTLETPPYRAFVATLTRACPLSSADVDAVAGLAFHVKNLASHSTVRPAGDRPAECCIIVDGMVVRSKHTASGQRQIFSFHAAGDMLDFEGMYFGIQTHDLTTLNECRLAFLSHAQMRALLLDRPVIAEALWRKTLADASRFREGMLRLGRQTAEVRIAHLFCEMAHRLNAVREGKEISYQFPATQVDIADAMGLSTVHVNRVVQELRRKRLITLSRSIVTVLDPCGLADLGEFDPLYLQFDGCARHSSLEPSD
jgi:CRP-like cAMP-binding protein